MDQEYLKETIRNLWLGQKSLELLIQMMQNFALVLSCFRQEQVSLQMLQLHSRKLQMFLSLMFLTQISLLTQLLNLTMRQQGPNYWEKPLLQLLNRSDQLVALDSGDKSFHYKIQIDCLNLHQISLMKMNFLLKQIPRFELRPAHQQPADLIADYFDQFAGLQKQFLFAGLIQLTNSQLLLEKWKQRNLQCYYLIYSHHSMLCTYCQNQRSYIFDWLASIFVMFYYNSNLYSIQSKQRQFGSYNRDQIVRCLTLPVSYLMMTQSSLRLTHLKLRKMKMSTKMILQKNYHKCISRS